MMKIKKGESEIKEDGGKCTGTLCLNRLDGTKEARSIT